MLFNLKAKNSLFIGCKVFFFYFITFPKLLTMFGQEKYVDSYSSVSSTVVGLYYSNCSPNHFIEASSDKTIQYKL